MPQQSLYNSDIAVREQAGRKGMSQDVRCHLCDVARCPQPDEDYLHCPWHKLFDKALGTVMFECGEGRQLVIEFRAGQGEIAGDVGG